MPNGTILTDKQHISDGTPGKSFAPATIKIIITDPPPQSPKVTTARGAADGSGEAWSRR